MELPSLCTTPGISPACSAAGSPETSPRSAGDVEVDSRRAAALTQPDGAVRKAAAARRCGAAHTGGDPLRQGETAPPAGDPLPPRRRRVDPDERLRLLGQEVVDHAANGRDVEAVISRPDVRTLDVEPVQARPARAEQRERTG